MPGLMLNSDYTDRLQALLGGSHKEKPFGILWRGFTTTTDKTELFIDGLSGYVLRPPASSVTRVQVIQGFGYDMTAGGLEGSTPENFTCTIVADADGVLTVTDAGNTLFEMIKATAADGLDYAQLNVTAADGNDVNWGVWANVACIPATWDAFRIGSPGQGPLNQFGIS